MAERLPMEIELEGRRVVPHLRQDFRSLMQEVAVVPEAPPTELPGFAGSRALMAAILEEALRSLEAPRGPERTSRMQERHSARAWFEDRATTWLFSFENICLHLGIDADQLRRALLGRPGRLVARLRRPVRAAGARVGARSPYRARPRRTPVWANGQS